MTVMPTRNQVLIRVQDQLVASGFYAGKVVAVGPGTFLTTWASTGAVVEPTNCKAGDTVLFVYDTKQPNPMASVDGFTDCILITDDNVVAILNG